MGVGRGGTEPRRAGAPGSSRDGAALRVTDSSCRLREAMASLRPDGMQHRLDLLLTGPLGGGQDKPTLFIYRWAASQHKGTALVDYQIGDLPKTV